MRVCEGCRSKKPAAKATFSYVQTRDGQYKRSPQHSLLLQTPLKHLPRKLRPKIQYLPVETKGQARSCELESRWCALLSSKVLPGSLVKLEGANVLLFCLKMIDLCDYRNPELLHCKSGNFLEGIRLQNTFHQIQVLDLL